MQFLLGKLTAMPAEQIQAMFWQTAWEQEAALNATRSDLTRLEVDAAEMRSRQLHAATHRNALAEFHAIYESLTLFDKTRLLAYLVVGENGATMWLLGKNPGLGDAGLNENRPHRLGTVKAVVGSGNRTRTYDKSVNSRLLYQLSYAGKSGTRV